MAKQTETSFWNWLFDGISCCGERGKSSESRSYSPPQENNDQSWLSSLSCGSRSKSEYHSNMELHHREQKSRESLGTTNEFEDVDIR